MNNKLIVGIFHPYSNAGGGGERVLWCAVRAIQTRYPEHHIAIYTGDCNPTEELLESAFKKFKIRIQNNNIQFVYLTQRSWVEAPNYPYFALLGQSLGSLILGTEALLKLVPGINNSVNELTNNLIHSLFQIHLLIQWGIHLLFPYSI